MLLNIQRCSQQSRGATEQPEVPPGIQQLPSQGFGVSRGEGGAGGSSRGWGGVLGRQGWHCPLPCTIHILALLIPAQLPLKGAKIGFLGFFFALGSAGDRIAAVLGGNVPTSTPALLLALTPSSCLSSQLSLFPFSGCHRNIVAPAGTEFLGWGCSGSSGLESPHPSLLSLPSAALLGEHILLFSQYLVFSMAQWP